MCGQWGHIIPTIPLAVALRRQGHRVRYAFVDHPPLVRLVTAHGFEHVALSMTRAEELAIMHAGTEAVAAMAPAERRERALATWFGPLAEPMVADLVELAASADAIVHENTTFAAPLAAAANGIPSVLHGTGASDPDAVRFAASTLAGLWSQWGQDMPALAGLMGDLYLSIFPPEIPEPSAVLGSVHPLRPEPPRDPTPAPPWMDELAGRPLVVVTLGTNFNRDAGLWDAVLRALSGAAVTVVAATGPGNVVTCSADNIIVEEYVPLAALLAKASLVICHGGAGTTLGALSLGVPLLLRPLGADQYHISGCVEAAGAGRALDVENCRDQVLAALGDDRLRGAAGTMRADIARMPDARDAAQAVERLRSPYR